jgi:hypothetical protein
MNRLWLLLLIAAVPLQFQEAPMPDLAKLNAMTARFSPVEISADISRLPAGERRALANLVQAGWMMDAIFFRQVWAGNESMLLDLFRDESALGRARLNYFLINKGPWSRLDANMAFIPGAPQKPAGANFYPADSSKEQMPFQAMTITTATWHGWS